MATYKLVNEEKLDAAMTATADAIRAKTGSTDPIAWDAEKGMSEAVEPVFEAGKKAEYDAFWDAYQRNGTLTEYNGTFSGAGWTDDIFLPKYDLICEGRLDNLFLYGNVSDIKGCLEKSGVVLNTAKATHFYQSFSNSRATKIPILDTSLAVSLYACFSQAKQLVSIDKIILNNNGYQNITHCFMQNPELRYVIFEGTFVNSGFNFSSSPLLSKESILSIVNALSNSTTGLSITLSLTAVNTAFETSTGAGDGSTSEEWAALIATKPNWTISLA